MTPRVEVERAVNVLGDEVQFFTPWPSDGDSQNYHLNSKYLTKDCDACPSCIPKERAIEVIRLAAQHTPHKWTPPEEANVRGICNWGKHLKTLVDRPRGVKSCSLISINPQS